MLLLWEGRQTFQCGDLQPYLCFPAPHKTAIITLALRSAAALLPTSGSGQISNPSLTALAHFFLEVQKGGREMSAVSQPTGFTDTKSPTCTLLTGVARKSRLPRLRCPASWLSAKSSRHSSRCTAHA